MPVFQLTDELVFPSPAFATEEGLLAVGGDLSRQRLLLAYSQGIFPWYSEGEPILWWSPNPRMVLIPDEFKRSRSLRKVLRSQRFRISFDTAFGQVVAACALAPRHDQDGTWITGAMERAYGDLHRAGYAHSVECWEGEALAGGLYGVSRGGCFFGESMFSGSSDASKLALWALVEHLKHWGFTLIDCQMRTEHLASLGARDVSRNRFQTLLKESLRTEDRMGQWKVDEDVLRSMD